MRRVPSNASGSTYLFAERWTTICWLLILILITSACLVQYIRHNYNRDHVDIFTVILNPFIRRYGFDMNYIRKTFVWANAAANPSPNHPHGRAAAARWNAITSIDNFAKAMLKTVFSISTSNREIGFGWRGNKNYHFAADLGTPSKRDNHTYDDIIALVDVDYYIPLDTLRPHNGKIIAMYTVQPGSVAGCSAESFWFVNKEGVYEEHVNGGAKYKHALWDYSSDIVIIRRVFSFTTYHCHIVPGRDNRALVVLVPIACVYLPFWLVDAMSHLLHGCAFKAEPLRRVGCVEVHGDIVSCSFQRLNEVWISIRKSSIESEDCVDIPLRVWNSIHTAALTAKSSKTGVYGITAIENILSGENITLPRRSGLYLLSEASKYPIQGSNPVNFTLALKSEDPEPGLFTLSAVPFIDPATGPNADAINVAKGIEERVVKVKNSVKPPSQYRQYAREFNKFIAPDRTNLTPFDPALALENMVKTKAQEAKFRNNSMLGPNRKDTHVKAFTKSEAVVGADKKAAPARLIYPTSPNLLLSLSQFTQPAKEFLKTHRFWAVGKSPHEISTTVCQYAGSQDCVETDFSKMDGTISEFIREQYGFFLTRLFRHEHKNEILAILRDHVGLKVFSPNGDKFKSGFMNPSGSADTTLLNTWTNSFVDYCANREYGLSDNEAWCSIGPKFGDDGIARFGPDYVATATAIGMTIKVEVVPAGSPISMLSRRFVSPKYTLTSIAEPARALSRIPVTSHSNAMTGLTNKVRGYLVTEGNVPLVGDYLNALVRVYGLGDPTQTSREEAYKLDSMPYPYDPAFNDEVLGVIAQRLNITIEEVSAYAQAFRDAKSVKDLIALSRHEGPASNGKILWLMDKPDKSL